MRNPDESLFTIETKSSAYGNAKLWDENQTQAEVVVPIVGGVVVPIRGTAVPGVVVPAATTVHAVGALRLSTTRLRHRLA